MQIILSIILDGPLEIETFATNISNKIINGYFFSVHQLDTLWGGDWWVPRVLPRRTGWTPTHTSSTMIVSTAYYGVNLILK